MARLALGYPFSGTKISNGKSICLLLVLPFVGGGPPKNGHPYFSNHRTFQGEGMRHAKIGQSHTREKHPNGPSSVQIASGNSIRSSLQMNGRADGRACQQKNVGKQGTSRRQFVFLGVPSPFFPGILLSTKPPKIQGKQLFLFKRTMVEENAESTPRMLG